MENRTSTIHSLSESRRNTLRLYGGIRVFLQSQAHNVIRGSEQEGISHAVSSAGTALLCLKNRDGPP